MSDNEPVERHMEQRLDKIEERFRRLAHSADNIDERFRDRLAEVEHLARLHAYRYAGPLYISPRLILISATLLNVALFIGGTVYTGVQVDSIQKRYEEASIKIVEAKQRYDEAESKLESIETVAAQTKSALSDIQRQSSQISSELRDTAERNAERVADVRERAERELDLLKQSGASILDKMHTYGENTEAELARAATVVASGLETKIQGNKKAIEDGQKDIGSLELKIEGLSAMVSKKELEISGIQKQIEDQLTTVQAVDRDLSKKIREIAESGEVTLPVVIGVANIWLKVVLGLAGVMVLVSFLLSLRTSLKTRSGVGTRRRI